MLLLFVVWCSVPMHIVPTENAYYLMFPACPQLLLNVLFVARAANSGTLFLILIKQMVHAQGTLCTNKYLTCIYK